MLESIRKRRAPLAAGLLAMALGCGLMAALPDKWQDLLTSFSENAVMRLAMSVRPPGPARPEIVVVDINSETIEQIGAWPWPRDRLASLLEVIGATKPKAVALDMFVAGADSRSPLVELNRRGITLAPEVKSGLTDAVPDGDTLVRKALSGAPVVMGLLIDPAHGARLPTAPILTRGEVDLSPVWQGKGVIGPYKPFFEVASGLGIIALPGDADGIVRRVPLFVAAAGVLYPGLALETARVAQEASTYLLEPSPIRAAALRLTVGDLTVSLPRDALLRLVPGTAHAGTIRAVSAGAVLDRSVDIGTGKIVLIGGSAPALGGLRTSQDEALVASVMLQARALDQVLAGLVPRRPPFLMSGLALLAVVLAGFALWAAMALGPVQGIVAMGLALLAPLGGALIAFLNGNWLIPPFAPVFLGGLTFVATSAAAFVQTYRREGRIRRRFEQHLAPQVVSLIVAEPGLLKLHGERREITALFTDIAGFTAMTERADPEALVSVLDDYFEGLAETIVRHGGMVDKIVGDAVHALFNAPLDLPDHPARAMAAAVEIRRWSEAFRKSGVAASIMLGETRIGLEAGIATVGDIGIRSKLDYTAHGAVMNSAARLEAANKVFGSGICLGPGIMRMLPAGTTRPLGEIRLRGFSSSVQAYEPWPEAATPVWRERYLEASRLAATDPGQAADLFEALGESLAGDRVCTIRAETLRKGPPEA
jgi:adenylate cyclase